MIYIYISVRPDRMYYMPIYLYIYISDIDLTETFHANMSQYFADRPPAGGGSNFSFPASRMWISDAFSHKFESKAGID